MKFKNIVILSSLVFASLSICFGTYFIFGTILQQPILTNVNNDDYRRVEFVYKGNYPLKGFDGEVIDENINKIIYVKNNTVLNLNDTPGINTVTSVTGPVNGLVDWVSSDNSIILGNLSENSKTSFTVNKDIVFNGSAKIFVDESGNVTNKTNLSEGVFSADEATKEDVSYSDNNTADINQNDSNLNKEIILDSPVINGSTIDVNMKDQDNNQTISQDLTESSGGFLGIGANYKDYQYTQDQTIGLEDSKSSKSSYKPNSGNSSNINPCSTRIILDQDTYLFGNSEINIGARTGYYNGGGWSQINFQNFINGTYNELDLNGYKLIIGNGCKLQAIGSIVDTSINKTGEIIVENGGTLSATLVIEDQHHESSMPLAYIMGVAPFRMFRMPYLNAKVTIKKGGFLVGNISIDLGGDSNNNMYIGSMNLIGNNNTYVFDTSKSNENSYIVRLPFYDESLINDSGVSSSSIVVNNIVYQKFLYSFYDCDIQINMPKWDNVSIEKLSLNIDFNRSYFIVPTYFQFYLYNSSATISNNITFYPGSYLYVDKNSSINLSYTEIINFNGNNLFDSDYYQGVGGLNFIYEKYDYTESFQKPDSKKQTEEYGRVDDGDTNSKGNYGGSTSIIFSQTSDFWKYMNKNYNARADIDGSINFIDRNDVPKKKCNFYLGGEINLKDVNAFKNTISTRSDVSLYNATVDGASNHMKFKISLFTPRLEWAKFNISDFYVYPMVSNGNVLMNLDNTNQVRDDYLALKITYDFERGLITDSDGDNYILLFSDGNNFIFTSNHLGKVCYNNDSNLDSLYDDLNVKLFKLSSYSNNIATLSSDVLPGSNNKQFVFFHGSFFLYNNGTVDISKFRARDSKYPDDGRSTRNIKAVENDSYYGHFTWRLK